MSNNHEHHEGDQDECVEPVPPRVREECLERDRHQCQSCGAKGPQAGGFATLEIHHIHRPGDNSKGTTPDDDEEEVDPHALERVVTLCRQCHNWIHKRPTHEDAPVDLTEADRRVLLPHDYEILQVLAERGPLSTGEIREAITPDHTSLAVRDRLWLLMGLDDEVPRRDHPPVDQDAETREWGLPEQITHSARGRIPKDTQTLIKRVTDEYVRRALDRGCDRKTVAEVLDVHKRTTRYMERRARAYDLPLDAISGQDRTGVTADRQAESGGDGDGDGDRAIGTKASDNKRDPDESASPVAAPDGGADDGSGAVVTGGDVEAHRWVEGEPGATVTEIRERLEEVISVLGELETAG